MRIDNLLDCRSCAVHKQSMSFFWDWAVWAATPVRSLVAVLKLLLIPAPQNLARQSVIGTSTLQTLLAAIFFLTQNNQPTGEAIQVGFALATGIYQ